MISANNDYEVNAIKFFLNSYKVIISMLEDTKGKQMKTFQELFTINESFKPFESYFESIQQFYGSSKLPKKLMM